ncbi:FAD-dependent monooxygenase [Siccirubricoccus sp. KC 17139]|uniref:FAD-dependent monooxygenase n=1 Tax=Siccirubricoccus soli TaxID=2899147 RepID=A0ABT1DA83_9PROT|nr:FAD-dependent monooxygenase [Siccirubricoccus soli]MCO6418857.1 FAD-dependent monooxygenase [Siccirubricoccus soli]MCP2684992.1 FAD-dependent monooxygenase [Siccirubricoccus soli]
MRSVPVVIAGGGPVGMTLARVLARFGIRCLLAERNPTTTRHPKMDITNSRSMEIFRRLGLAEALRAVAVPEANNFDVSWITTMAGHELHRFRYPSVEEWRARQRERNDGTMPREAPMRVSQVEIEPVLQRALLAEELVEARWGLAFESFAEDAAGVTVTLRDSATGAAEQVRCAYLAGCDGGGSLVRRQLGIPLEGQARVMPRFMTHFRSDDRALLQRFGVAWHYQGPYGTLIAQNDVDVWTLQSRFPPGVEDPGAVDPHALLRAFAGRDIAYEILVANHWHPHLLVAESYGSGRVFLAGDAAHQYIPTGGYGMNTGIGDAMDLGWKLAARLHGFGGPVLLPSYEAERLPIGRRNRDASGRHTGVRIEIAAAYAEQGAALMAAGPAGEAARAAVASRIAALGNAENESWGIEHGYAYRDSPVIAAEPGAALPEDPLRYEPVTLPGVRLPSLFLEDGRAIHDLLGPWFTLLAVGVVPSGALVAAAERGLGLTVLETTDPVARRVYGEGLFLVRPDQHIAWRGRALEDGRAAQAVIGRALGWVS